MENSHSISFIIRLITIFVLASLLFSHLASSHGVSLHHGWSFSVDLSLNSSSSTLPINAYTSPVLSLFTPILSSTRFSTNKGFSLGFYSIYQDNHGQQLLPSSVFLSICLGSNRTDSNGRSFAAPVWSLNIHNPMKQLGKTGLISLNANTTSNALQLRNGNGSLLWSLNGALSMELNDSGNWIIYGSDSTPIWQSFDHPTDTLMQGQVLQLGKKLISNNSLFTVQMMPGGIVFYMNSEAPSPLAYWAVPINITALEYFVSHPFDLVANPIVNLSDSFYNYACPQTSKDSIKPYAILSGQNFTVEGGCAHYQWARYSNTFLNLTYPADFIRLADNGYPQGYTYLYQDGSHYFFSAQSDLSYCLAPNSCGPYGICSEFMLGTQHTCKCPSPDDNPEFEDAFKFINPSDPSQGCVRTTPLDCLNNGEHSLVQLKKTTFISIHPVFETTFRQNTRRLKECIDYCRSNCSCSGFFYHSPTSYCMPFSDSGGLSNLTFITLDSSSYSTYIKLHHLAGLNHVSASATASHAVSGIVFAIAGVTVIIITLLVAFSWKRYKRYRIGAMEKGVSDEDIAGSDGTDECEELEGVLPVLPMRYSYKELDIATGGFKKMVGVGGFGCVYEGVLSDGRKVAVKKLDGGPPKLKQFLAEVATIGAISHYNITSLCGFCSQKTDRLLVYEFMENGSLDQWLFSKDPSCVLDWHTRFHVALGTARGLAYLHDECPQPIIHFDVKPQNILLDKDFVPKISDFGLSKLVAREASSFVITAVRGTPGYLAPEWLSHSAVSKKCDVYSFGMVLFELVGGRRNVVQSLAGTDQWYFPTWVALNCKQGKVLDLVDKHLGGDFDEDQVKRVIHIAFLCIQRDPSLRPSMTHVYKMLDSTCPLGDEEPPYGLGVEPLTPQSPISYVSCSTTIEGR